MKKIIWILLLPVLALAVLPQSLPLVTPSDVSYIGSFALPSEPSGTSRFGYGGHGITPYHDPVTGKFTLFIEGHVQKPGQVAQVEIPPYFSTSSIYAMLPVATFVQPFYSIASRSLELLTGTTSPNGVFVYGMLAYQNRLIVSATEYYGNTQKASHEAVSLNLSTIDPIMPFSVLQCSQTSNVRSTSGSMTPIPIEWQSLLGGTVLTGNWAIPVVSGNSAGPAVAAFDPANIPGNNPIPSSTLLFYPVTSTVDHALCLGSSCTAPAPEATSNAVFNLATHYGGMAFPSGTRSVLFIGRVGVGTYCYGTAVDCHDPVELDNKGPHAYPYYYQVWGYDANDLLAVKMGAKKPWEPKPYGMARVSILDHWRGSGAADIVGAGYDPETRRWFVTTMYAEQPRVDVFQIRTF